MPFDSAITSVEELRRIYRPPAGPALRKQIDHIDEHCAAFIAHSPFVIVSTTDAEGRCDVSPKGGPPGFVAVLDEHRVALPDFSGNNRLDSFENLVDSPGIALLFLIPGQDETLRVNGRATLTTDAAVLQAASAGGITPKVAVGVDVREAYIHCAKALRRGSVWDTAAWPDRSDMATPTAMLVDHCQLEEFGTIEAMEARLEKSYAATMWKAGGE